MTESPGMASQSYYHGCDGDDPEGGNYVLTLSECPPGTVFPPTKTLDGPCILCGADPIEMRAVSLGELADLGVDLEELHDDDDEEC